MTEGHNVIYENYEGKTKQKKKIAEQFMSICCRADGRIRMEDDALELFIQLLLQQDEGSISIEPKTTITEQFCC